MHVKIFGQSMVILHSLQAARDLLDKRSSIYSDRPRFVLLSELYVFPSFHLSCAFADQCSAGWAGRVPLHTWDSTLVTCPLVLTLTNRTSGPRFRKHRRFINQVFNQKGISTFRPLQEKEILVLLEGMLHHPDDFVDHFRRFATFQVRPSDLL